MIQDLNPSQLGAYYQRVLANGVDGLKGIEIFQAKQVWKYAETQHLDHLELL